MPTFFVWPLSHEKEDRFWVYAIDDWDARAQVASTLGIDAHDESTFGCKEDDRFSAPLNVIVHANGERTEVPEPPQIRERLNVGCSGDC